jgi:TDG/mug DNA glycosylase family protein
MTWDISGDASAMTTDREEDEVYLFETLPDYLAPGLRLVFVGINPAILSVQKGRYFWRKTNRFWPALSRSRLSQEIRAGLGRDELGPEDDARLLAFGIGFTDVVKVPSANASQVSPALFAEWAPRLRARLERFQPTVAAFQGVTGYRAFERYALGVTKSHALVGPQGPVVGRTRLFVVPNPSPANFHFRPADQVAWYDRLADFIDAKQSNGGRT